MKRPEIDYGKLGDSRKQIEVRVRIHKKSSMYDGLLGEIHNSQCNGYFIVRVNCEGFPRIELLPSEVEPC